MQPRQTPDGGAGALDENVEAIKRWEQVLLHERSAAERLSDRITVIAASGPMLAAHLVWFLLWIGLNRRLDSAASRPSIRSRSPS